MTSAKTFSLPDLSPEILCHVFQYVPIKKVLACSMLCRKLSDAVDLYLRMRKSIDFCEGKIYAYMSLSITDDCLHSLLKKCPQLETVYGLHPVHIERRRLRKRTALTVPGILDALSICPCLKAIETSDLKLLEAIMQHMPQLEIIGCIRNRDGIFPPHASQRLKLQPYPKITSLHLIGVEVPELTAMPHLQHLHLQCVRFTKLQPFRAFIAKNLQSFVMKHCMGPSISLRYLSLIIALSSSPSLRRLELVRVPLPGGLFQRAVEDSYRHNGFVRLTTLVIAGCKGVLEADIGHLMIVASQNLEYLYIQPSLTKDSLFVSLFFAHCSFPKLRTLYLGYSDVLNTPDDWSNDALLSLGLAETPDSPSSLTDSGMRIIGFLFTKLESLSVSNCPHLISTDSWSDGARAWRRLLDLTFQKCHCLRLSSFSAFLASLPKVEVVILIDMFREPPKGCSHVGLSAGTGLGMSSAVVSNQDEHIAVQGHPVQDFEPLAEENLLANEEIDRDFIENDDGFHEPHLLALQQELINNQNQLNNPEEPLIPEVLDIADEMPEQNAHANEQLLELDDIEIKIEEDSLSLPPTPPSEINILDDAPEPDIQSVNSFSYHNENANCSCVDDSSLKVKNTYERREKRKKAPNSCKKDYEPMTISFVRGDNSKSLNYSEISGPECSDEESYLFQSESHSHSNKSRQQAASSPTFLCCDPNQPSTSKSTCYHACDSESYHKTENEVHNESLDNEIQRKSNEAQDEPVHKILISKILDVESPPKKIKTEAGSDIPVVNDTSFCNNIKNESSDSDVAFVGPITRHRKKMLERNAGVKRKSSKNSYQPQKFDNLSDNQNNTTFQCSPCSVLLSRVSRSELHELPSQSGSGNTFSNELESSVSQGEGNSYEPVFSARNKGHVGRQKEIEVVSQGTEATSEDIRWCLRLLKSKKKPDTEDTDSKNFGSNRALPTEQSTISRRIKHKKKVPLRSKSKESKATSTSDPLLEDDAVQVLRLASDTLCSLTVVACGLSDIVIDRSNNLSHVEVQGCRIMRSCQIYFCPSLKRLNISQCPKLQVQKFLPYILDLQSNSHLMVSFEPCTQGYNPADVESFVFDNASLDQNIILCHDLTKYPQEFNQTLMKARLWAWMEATTELLKDLGFKVTEPKVRIKPEEELVYPWGHDVRRIHGFGSHEFSEHYDKNLKYDILTNSHVFASALEIPSWRKGFPLPDSNYFLANANFLYEAILKSLKKQMQIKTFFIPVNDRTSTI